VFVRVSGRLCVLTLVTALALGACGASSLASPVPSASTPPPSGGGGVANIPQPPTDLVALLGAGGTLPAPLFKVWFKRFGGTYPNVAIDYAASSSSAGVAAVADGTADFGATEVTMSDTEIEALPAATKVLHVPAALAAVVVVYNVPGVTKLQLDGATLAAIYLGQITRWNDPRIAGLNAGTTLPDQQISPVHRAEPSGASDAFTTFLDLASREWHTKAGAGPTVTWPAGTPASGDDGVASAVAAKAGAIGYVGLAYAGPAQLPTARLRNQAGSFVQASTLSIGAAGETGGAGFPADFRQPPVIDAPGINAYPIVTYVYFLVRVDQADAARGQALLALIAWAITTGQVDTARLGYAPLPGSVQQQVRAALHTVTSGGKPIWP
jgi:phosphate transport system substrate-binding protein